MNTERLKKAITALSSKLTVNADYYAGQLAERSERKAYYQSFTREKLLSMSESVFLEYIGRLWSMSMWGNKQYLVGKLISDNGFDAIKKHIAELLFGTKTLEKRWDSFKKNVKGIGPATISELLQYVYPDKCIILNKSIILCLSYLGIQDIPRVNYQYTGAKYVELCKVAQKIANALQATGMGDCDMLAVDYFLWDEVLPFAEQNDNSTVIPTPIPVETESESRSLHDEIKEKLVAIGNLLGFESKQEVRISAGAIVDAVWEAKIGNMGKAIYVFEVQSRGSTDSLILNLKKALNNAAVQAVVAVADEDQLMKIVRESEGVIERKSLRTWKIEEVLAVYDNLARAHESINQLALVPESF